MADLETYPDDLRKLFTYVWESNSICIEFSNGSDALTKEKAKKMGVNLLLADEYTQLPEIKHLEKKNTHVYISCSKNGKQYLDSLGGNCEIGGYYRQRELPYWRCEED